LRGWEKSEPENFPQITIWYREPSLGLPDGDGGGASCGRREHRRRAVKSAAQGGARVTVARASAGGVGSRQGGKCGHASRRGGSRPKRGRRDSGCGLRRSNAAPCGGSWWRACGGSRWLATQARACECQLVRRKGWWRRQLVRRKLVACA
jgi:hypothetical protein